MNAELHTGLIDEEKRTEIVSGGKKIGALIEAVANQNEGGIYNTFKEGIVGIYFDEFRKENQEVFNLLKDETLSDNKKVQILSILQEQFYKKHGYEGTLPQLMLTDEARSFTQDGIYKITGEKRVERILISINDLLNPNLSAEKLLLHENGHLNTYNEGKFGEETSWYMTSKLSDSDKTKTFTEEERVNYLSIIKEKYTINKSIEEQFAEAKKVLDREYYYDKETHQRYINPNLTKEEIYRFSKEYGVSEKEVKENQTKYVYYDALKTKNREFKNKEEFLKYQEKTGKVYLELPNEKSLFHNLYYDEKNILSIDLSFPNEKYIFEGEEAVFNKKTGETINDNINNGTYNIAAEEEKQNFFENMSDSITHAFGDFSDINLWVMYGVSPKDTTTLNERRIILDIGTLYYTSPSFKNFALKKGKANIQILGEYLELRRGGVK